MKHAGGRPTDYNEELIKEARKYVAFFDAEDVPQNVPSVADMAYNLGISRSTIYEWAKEHKEFSDILENVLALQEKKLLKYGLNGNWNPTITKLMLSKHGYRESQDITTDGKALPTPILNGLPSDHSTKEDTRD